MVAVELSKVVVVIVNVIFMFFGLASLIVGIVFKVGWSEVRDVFEDKSKDVDINLQEAGDTVAWGAIIFGAAIILLSFMGCVGACCKVRCLLVVYAIIVIILLISQIAIVAVVAIKGDDVKADLEKGLKETLKNYYENSTGSSSKAYSALFSTLECCGITNYSGDFHTDTPNVPFYKDPARPGAYDTLVIPLTCCKGANYESKFKATDFTAHDACLKLPTTKNAYTKGCVDSVVDAVEDNKAIFIGVGITILVIEVIVVIMAFIICCRYDD